MTTTIEIPLIQKEGQRTLADVKFHHDPRWGYGAQVAFCFRWGTESQWHVIVLPTLGM